MKKLIVIALAIISFAAEAQTTKVLLKQENNYLFNYGRQIKATTTDATQKTIDSVPIAANEAGIFELQVVGLSTAGEAVTGSTITRYVKKSGTLTVATDSIILAKVTDTGVTNGAYAWSVSSDNNLLLKVTGQASKTINWIVNVRRISQQ
ncbi:hypothetical protein QTN47_17085 [Danxiaibacter flavus]|uniref:Uncharacterized protein n=1 Tax=Danxiaibacter flavus TaxID=3049108 RepID=A0ABV3ZH99_9BACT|nr:hypothetical protein QNM32_17095 [Chitinophagaceae bacterium DXS]